MITNTMKEFQVKYPFLGTLWVKKSSLICDFQGTQLLHMWRNVQYNHGNHFSGTFFTAPVKGWYIFRLVGHRATEFGDVCLHKNSFEWGKKSLWINGKSIKGTTG